jgi:TonB-linked SusC/RagA family outer membrane protein
MTPSLNYGYSIRLLTCLSLFLCTTGLNAQATSPGDMKVSVTGDHITYREVFNALRKQTGLWFVYSNEDFNQDALVSVSVKGGTLDGVLGGLFRGSEYTWSYHNKSVAIARVDGGKDSLITVTGRVVDEKGNPIIGASILLKGTKTGAVTNQDGIFNVKTVKPNGSLIVSSVGFLTKEIPVNNRMGMGQIQLKEYVGALDEVQVQAYGTTTRRLGTGNIVSIKAEDIARTPTSNSLLAIQGRVAGIFIEQATGLSGSGIRVQIQGQNSIAYGNDPLYVIDGVPYISQLLTPLNGILGSSGGRFGQSGSPLSFLNPLDIERIDILKDGDATAIYGSRAANGAILITTKKGKSDQTLISINAQNGFGKITKKINLLSTSQYLNMRNKAISNDGIDFNSPPYDADFYKAYLNADLNYYNKNRFTDWQKELIGGTATFTNAQLSMSGGSVNGNYLISGNYYKEKTVFPGDFANEKGSFHISLDNSTNNKRFRLTFSGNYQLDNNDLPGTDLTNAAITLAPNAPALYNNDKSINWAPITIGNNTYSTFGFTQPLPNLLATYNTKSNNLIINTVAVYNVFRNIEVKTSFGYTLQQTSEKSMSPLFIVKPEDRPYSYSTSSFSNGRINSWIIEPHITYNAKINHGKLDVLIGTTIQQINTFRQAINALRFPSDLQLEDIRAAAIVNINDATISNYKYNALFSRLTYNTYDKYIINLNIRRDGSSRFGPKNRFHNFGSIGLAWIFSNENLIRKNFGFLSFGKIRISYGTTGNDQIGDYGFLNQYSTVSQPVPYQGTTSLIPIGLPNPYLQWEETKKLQAGVDLGFFNDNILINLNYFRNRSSNQLLNYILPVTTGFTSITENFPATVQNTGLELTFNSTNIKKGKFYWKTNINLTIPRNKLIAFNNLEQSSYASGSNALIIGKSINIIHVFHYLGVDPKNGLYQVADKQGIATSDPNYNTDRTVTIDLNPKYYGGISNNLRYKDISLDFLFTFSMIVAQNYKFGRFPGGLSNQPLSIINAWETVGQNASIQKYTTGLIANGTNTAIGAAFASDEVYSDASILRLKNVSISWNIGPKIKSKLLIRNLKLYVNASNLLTITNYKGLDPETRSTGSLPPLKIITIGLQLDL